MVRTGLYYFTSLKQRVFKCRWFVTLDGALDPLSDQRSWCDSLRDSGTHYWGLDLSPFVRMSYRGQQ